MPSSFAIPSAMMRAVSLATASLLSIRPTAYARSIMSWAARSMAVSSYPRQTLCSLRYVWARSCGRVSS